MLIYARLWLRFFSMAFAKESEYRANFAMNVFESALSLGLGVLAYVVLYGYTADVNGWSRAEALMLLGVFQMVVPTINLLFGANMWHIADHIREGEMDYLLRRPVSSRFLATLRNVELFEIPNAMLGLGLVVYAGNVAGVEWSLPRILAAVLLGACGLALIYSAWCAVVTLAFWFQGGLLDPIFFWVLDVGRYPVTFFRGWVRLFLTWVLPVAFATTFPTQALLGELDPGLLLAGPAFACAALAATGWFWEYGARRYSSASS